jgi:hypothetical protein
MRRLCLVIAIATLGVSFLLLNNSEIAHAQTPRSGTDTIRFTAATRGNDYDNSGYLEWCWVLQSKTTGVGWHGSYPGGPPDALDEVAQQRVAPTPPYTQDQWWASCHSNSTEVVDLAAFGFTDNLNCTAISPCYSLIGIGTSGFYPQDHCNFIEVALYDWGTWDPGHGTGDWKGTQRMIHTQAPSTSFSVPLIPVTTSGAYYRWAIGTVLNDISCAPNGVSGFQNGGYHVHHDWMPPTIVFDPVSGTVNCYWNVNTNVSPITPPTPSQPPMQQTDWRKENPDHWIHYLVHAAGQPCFDPGPSARDFLLAPSGALNGDQNGAGTRDLARGGPGYTITTPQTCFTGTSWCGIISVTQPLLQGAFNYNQGMSPVHYFNARQVRFPSRGVMAEWYNDGTYSFQVRNNGDIVWYPGDYYVGNCPYHANSGEPVYTVSFSSSALSCGVYGAGPPPYGATVPGSAVNQLWAGFRGLNGVNPSVPPTQTDANTWAQTQIDSGHWTDVVMPAIAAMIGGVRDQRDLATLGITGNPPFDGNLGQAGLASIMTKMNPLASRITKPLLYDGSHDEMNRDWIRSARTRWKLTRKTFEIVPS